MLLLTYPSASRSRISDQWWWCTSHPETTETIVLDQWQNISIHVTHIHNRTLNLRSTRKWVGIMALMLFKQYFSHGVAAVGGKHWCRFICLPLKPMSMEDEKSRIIIRANPEFEQNPQFETGSIVSTCKFTALSQQASTQNNGTNLFHIHLWVSLYNIFLPMPSNIFTHIFVALKSGHCALVVICSANVKFVWSTFSSQTSRSPPFVFLRYQGPMSLRRHEPSLHEILAWLRNITLYSIFWHLRWLGQPCGQYTPKSYTCMHLKEANISSRKVSIPRPQYLI